MCAIFHVRCWIMNDRISECAYIKLTEYCFLKVYLLFKDSDADTVS